MVLSGAEGNSGGDISSAGGGRQLKSRTSVQQRCSIPVGSAGRLHDCLRTGIGVTSTGSTKRRRQRQERRAKEDLRERAARARRAAPASPLSPRRPAPAPARMRDSAHSRVRAAAGSRAPAYTTCTRACEPRRPLRRIRQCTA